MLILSLWRFVSRSPWSTGMAVVGICLGVSSVVSVHLISQQVAGQLTSLQPQQLAAYSHFLHRDNLHTDSYFELRSRWRRGELTGLRSLTPVVDDWSVMHGRTVRIIGIDLLAAGGELWRGEQSSAGFSWNGVWLDASLSDLPDIAVNGVMDLPPGTLIADIGVAQKLLGWPPQRISYVAASFADPWVRLRDIGEQLLPGLAAGLPAHKPQADLADWQVLTPQQQNPASQFGNAVLFNVSALAILAMLVAWFLIYQVALSWRRKLLATMQRLHLLGVGWLTLSLYFVGMLLSLGLLGGLLGLFSGWWLAHSLLSSAVDVVPQLTLDGWVVLKGLGSALGVCLIGGGWAILRDQLSDVKAVLPVLVVVFAAVFFWGLTGGSGLLGAFASVAVASFLTVLMISPVLRLLRRWSAHLSSRGFTGNPLLLNGLREVVWYPQDLSVALGGLTLAIATAIGVAAMVDSFRSDFEQFLQHRLSYDLVVEGPAEHLQAFTLAQARAEPKDSGLSEVDWQRLATVQTYQRGQLRSAGNPTLLTATRLNAFELARYQADPLQMDVKQQVLVSEQLARTQQLDSGDSLTIAGQKYPIAAVFQGFGDLQARIVVDHAHPLAARAQELYSVSLRGEALAQLLPQLSAAFPELRFSAQDNLRDTALQTFDRTFAITDVLISIALMVAAIGVYIANSTLRLNQRTASRLLLSLGVSAAERLAMDIARSLAIGIAAVIIAVPLGMVFGYILCELINPRAFGWAVSLRLHMSVFLWPVSWGICAALLAGLIRFGQREESQYANLSRL